MSDDKSNWDVGGLPAAPMGLVKGGTSRSSYDRSLAEADADTKARQAADDQRAAMTESADPQRPRIQSMRFIDQATPRLVLYYMNKDKTVRQEAISEITMVEGKEQGTLDLVVAMVCPKCVDRGEPQWNAQMLLKSSHRKFHIDEKRKGEVVTVNDPLSPTGFRMLVIAGTITAEETIKCSNYNCTFACKIDNSQVWEA
jgi:hypothetical protein